MLIDTGREEVVLHCGDALEVLRTLPDASIDAVVSDPPYPEIDRPYGRLTEAEWAVLMQAVVRETRRVLTPQGSAVFILQPNSERVGRMRPWLWDFLSWCCREWNVVQDAYWWNFAAIPVGGAITDGLLRGSIKQCAWLGASNCYRNQDAVVWTESEITVARRRAVRAGTAYSGTQTGPSGLAVNRSRVYERSDQRGGSCPFNVIPLPNSDPYSGAGAAGHGAGTPLPLCEWWIRYLTKPGQVVLDMFGGSGTVAEAAVRLGRRAVLIERDRAYCDMAVSRFNGGIRAAKQEVALGYRPQTCLALETDHV